MGEVLLLDTCALLWLAQGGGSLTATTIARIDEANEVVVSAISAFEIGLKAERGLLELPLPAERWFAEVCSTHRLREIPLNGSLAAQACRLPTIHKDPCDRFITATAFAQRCPVVTADAIYRRYGVEVMS